MESFKDTTKWEPRETDESHPSRDTTPVMARPNGGSPPARRLSDDSFNNSSFRRENVVLDGSSEWLRRLMLTNASSVVSEWYAIAIIRYFLWILRWKFVGPYVKRHKRRALAQLFFGMSLFMRPFGAIVLGHIADSSSRIQALSISLICSAAATTLLPFVPEFRSIGPLSSYLAIGTQVISGVAVGGQLPGAFVTMYEAAPKAHRYYYVALMQFQAVGGVVLAAIVAAVYDITVNDVATINRLWKYPFVLTSLLALPGLYFLRALNRAEGNKDQEKQRSLTAIDAAESAAANEVANPSPSFTRVAAKPAPIADLCANHLCTIVLVFLSSALWSVAFWILFGWFHERAPLHTLLSLTVFFLSGPIVAMVADSPSSYRLPSFVTAKSIVVTGATLVGILAPLVFRVFAGFRDKDEQEWEELHVRKLKDLSAGQAVGLASLSLLCGLYAGPLPAYLAMQFPKKVRYSGLAIGWGASQMIFASTAGNIAAEIAYNYSVDKIGYYISLVAFISAAACCFLNPTEPTASVVAGAAGSMW